MVKSSQYNNVVYETTESVYCYNSFSGELIKFSRDVYNHIENITNNSKEENIPYLDYLLKKGFLVDSNTDEYVKIQAMRREVQYSLDSDRASFVIALTTKCNIKCIYCYESGCVQKTMETPVANQAIEFIKEKCENNTRLKVLNLTWFGGEPLLAIENIKLIGNALLKFCSDKNILFQTNIITNALLLDDEKFNILKKYNLTDVQISMDGCEDYYQKYKGIRAKEFEALLLQIEKICVNTKVNIRLNCSSENFNSIKRLMERLYSSDSIRNNVSLSFAQLKSENIIELSNDEFSQKKIKFAHYLSEIGWKSQLQNFIPTPKTIPCGLMQSTNFVIDPEGYLYKCEHYVGNSQFSVGNVEKGVLYPSFYNDFLECEMFDTCKTCSIYPICRGGCSQKRFIGEKSVSCQEKKKEIQELFQIIIKNNESSF